MRIRWMLPALVLVGAMGACTGESDHAADDELATEVEGEPIAVRDTMITAAIDAAGVARAVAEATLSTKLMGAVEAVAVEAGDRVSVGQVLVRIDASDLVAKEARVEASIREAEAVLRNAEAHAERMRVLYAEEAAPEVQLDEAETGLERARAGLAAARAAAAEVEATSRYATIRAPFDGVVTARMVDVGDFAAPGAPMARVLDADRLRIAATAAPRDVAGIGRGDTLRARIEGTPARAVVEGIVPNDAGNLYRVNAIVENRDGRFLPGSAADLELPQGQRRALLIPSDAVIRQGDLTGVRVRTGEGTVLRWIRLGDPVGDLVEVLAGVEADDVVLVGPTVAAAREEG